jgi:hypothetical protein
MDVVHCSANVSENLGASAFILKERNSHVLQNTGKLAHNDMALSSKNGNKNSYLEFLSIKVKIQCIHMAGPVQIS